METLPKNSHLNLARKLRPQSFDQIVGQTITVRILKNSLFLKKYFPVYLFAGQRGCGKTTTARIFAAAINCQNLSVFQAQPTTNSIPCLQCQSCQAMTQAHHPDFIEIDAASHTGVDNVRQIIEASSYIPLLGQKKIYLIDEAHMLSKAAFNAFLKILEEPSETVLFILATTELSKIPQTVLSRCFQLSFTHIDHDALKNHLNSICSTENIAIEDEALDIIIEETDGSARDALNLLEQVRFSTDKITSETLLKLLGKVSNTIIIKLFEHILTHNPTELLLTLKHNALESTNPQQIWNTFIELCQALLWIKYGIETLPNQFNKNFDTLWTIASNCSLNRLYAIMQLLWQQEPLFLQTNKKQIFLEMTLLQMCQQTTLTDIEELIKMVQQNTTTESSMISTLQESQKPKISSIQETTQENLPKLNNNDIAQKTQSKGEHEELWTTFKEKLNEISKDLLLNSILMQAQFLNFNKDNGTITLGLSNNGKFFKDKLEESKSVITTLLAPIFPHFSTFHFIDTPSATTTTLPKQPLEQALTTPIIEKKIIKKEFDPSLKQKQDKQVMESIDISDKLKWPFTHLILNYFPGKIKKIIVSNGKI